MPPKDLTCVNPDQGVLAGDSLATTGPGWSASANASAKIGWTDFIKPRCRRAATRSLRFMDLASFVVLRLRQKTVRARNYYSSPEAWQALPYAVSTMFPVVPDLAWLGMTRHAKHCTQSFDSAGFGNIGSDSALPVNPLVVGSSPTRGAKISISYRIYLTL